MKFREKSLLCRVFMMVIILFLSWPLHSFAYSVLTEEAIIDACWDQSIRPLIIRKYPRVTEDQLRDAHAYAYGGAVVPDIGFFPLGSRFFTQATHYIRTGDFLRALFDESENINELAFACGFLCHYYADIYGHKYGINICVPIIYPHKVAKHGSVMTFEQDQTAHVRTEFSFDVLQKARGNYASQKCHRYIGFKISRPLMQRAFLKTYGLNIKDVFRTPGLAVKSFSWVASDLFPDITLAAWVDKKDDIEDLNPTVNSSFKCIANADFCGRYKYSHEKPGFVPHGIAMVMNVLPKAGPLKFYKIRVPGNEAEIIFMQSFDSVLCHYNSALRKLPQNDSFLNIDFDTGNETWCGEYSTADCTYFALLLRLKCDHFRKVDRYLQQNIISFYEKCSGRLQARAGKKKWNELSKALVQLKALAIVCNEK